MAEEEKNLPCMWCSWMYSEDASTYYCGRYTPSDILENVFDETTRCNEFLPFSIRNYKKIKKQREV